MFCQTGTIYTVHENATLPDAADRVELVREGFAVWALLFGAMWLLAHRLWLPALAYIIIAALVVQFVEMMGCSDVAVAVIQLGIQYWLGCSAYDIQRWALARRGYHLRGVVCANSELSAQQRAFAVAA